MSNDENNSPVNGRGKVTEIEAPQCDTPLLSNDLRRPYITPPEVQQDLRKNSTITGNQKSIPVSVLSADAPEFIPKSSYCDQNRTLQHESSEANFQYDSSAANCLQSNNVADLIASVSTVSSENAQFAVPQLKYVYHPVIVQVNDFVVKLSLQPHKFDNISSKLTSVLSSKVTDKEIMKEAVSVIFEQGIGEPNFRFNGGRLCQHLCKYVTQSYNGPSFRSLLLNRCQEEFNCRGFYLQNDIPRLCGFTLFLADIFVNVVTAASKPLDKLREALCALLMLVLSLPSDMTLKCVMQTLKGTGSVLDRDGDFEDVNRVMHKVKDVTMGTGIPDGIRSQLLSVIELRASGWGKRREEVKSTNETKTPQMGTIYYGVDGRVERVEEEINYSSSSDTEDSQDGLPFEFDEMEAEIASAFEEFLRTQNT